MDGNAVMGKATGSAARIAKQSASKDVSKAMSYEASPIKSQVSARVVRKEIYREMDNLSLGWHVLYNLRRYKFQLSVIINVVVLGLPVFRFVHQFFI